MFNLFDWLAEIGEHQSEHQIERLTRMYPYLFGYLADKGAAAPAKIVRNHNELRSLETRRSHTA